MLHGERTRARMRATLQARRARFAGCSVCNTSCHQCMAVDSQVGATSVQDRGLHVRAVRTLLDLFAFLLSQGPPGCRNALN